MIEPVRTFSSDGEPAGSVALSPEIFDIEPSEYALYQSIRTYLGNQRQGTASTKGRSEVNKSGRKPYRQKGTGRARVGTRRSPLLRGGGVIFGPKPKSYRRKLPKKLKGLALKSALSLKGREGGIRIVEDFLFSKPSTRAFRSILSNMGVDGQKLLFLTAEVSPEVIKSCRNLPDVQIKLVHTMCTYDVLDAGVLIFTRSALAKLEQELGERA